MLLAAFMLTAVYFPLFLLLATLPLFTIDVDYQHYYADIAHYFVISIRRVFLLSAAAICADAADI